MFFNEAGCRIGRCQRSWKTACKTAGPAVATGEPERLFHDLRRSGVRNLIRAGVSETVDMRISGHKTRSVFERYNIVSERDLHDAARKLENYVAERAKAAQPGHTSGRKGKGGGKKPANVLNVWLGRRDSNPDTQIQSLQSYR